MCVKHYNGVWHNLRAMEVSIIHLPIGQDLYLFCTAERPGPLPFLKNSYDKQDYKNKLRIKVGD